MNINENNKFTFEIVADMLKSFIQMKKDVALLDDEIKNYVPVVSDKDMIDSMTFSRPDSECVNNIHSGKINDKTASIAISYSEKMMKINIRHKEELENDLCLILSNIRRLEHYVRSLDEIHASVLEKLYFEGLTYVETGKALMLSISAIKRYRRAGIERIVAMYDLIATIS